MQVQSGRYGSAGDVVWAGLRLLEAHETRVKKALQDALIAGEQSGDPPPFDFEEFAAVDPLCLGNQACAIDHIWRHHDRHLDDQHRDRLSGVQ